MKLPDHTQAAVLRAFGTPLVIEEVAMPDHLEPGALLVEIEACSICGTDLHLTDGHIAQTVTLPVIPGHEMVGRIVAMGQGAERDSIGQDLRLGDRVTWSHAFCGECYTCRIKQRPTLCDHPKYYMYSTMTEFPYLMGGFAKHCYVLPNSGRIRIRDDVASDLASMSSCAFRSVIHAFEQCGKIDLHETVVIQGAGPLGILAAGVAHMSGARRVIVIGAPDDRLALALDFGADETVSVEASPDAEARRDRVMELTGGRGGDVVLELSGASGAFGEGLRLAAKGGRVMSVGQVGPQAETIVPSLITNRNLRIIGSSAAEARHYWKALEFIGTHQARLPFQRILTDRFPLSAINEALESTRQRKQIKPVVLPN